jgi:hypothetical protein
LAVSVNTKNHHFLRIILATYSIEIVVIETETSHRKDATLPLSVSKSDDFDGNGTSLRVGKLSSGREM